MYFLVIASIVAQNAVHYEIREATVRNQISALNNQHLSLSIQGGNLWRQRYRAYKSWRMERKINDEYHRMELSHLNRQKHLPHPPSPEEATGIRFGGRTFRTYDELRNDPKYQEFLERNEESREWERERDLMELKEAIESTAERKHPDDFYKKRHSGD